MRGYQCHFYHLNVQNKLEKNNNDACWAGINGPLGKGWGFNIKMDKENEKFIFVDRFVEKETQAYIPLLIRILNKVTPTELVEIDGKQYIKTKLLGTYDQSLIILNFLRNLWSCPTVFNGTQARFKDYIPTFFETLKTARKYKDPLKRLLWANKIACEKAGCVSMGHSNIHSHDKLQIRPMEELIAYNGHSTMEFLTGGMAKAW